MPFTEYRQMSALITCLLHRTRNVFRNKSCALLCGSLYERKFSGLLKELQISIKPKYSLLNIYRIYRYIVWIPNKIFIHFFISEEKSSHQ